MRWPAVLHSHSYQQSSASCCAVRLALLYSTAVVALTLLHPTLITTAHSITLRLTHVFCFACAFDLQGSALNLVQDLPISKPLTANEINTLSSMVVLPTLCSFYSDLKSVQPRLAAAVDRMKALSGVVHVALCKVCGGYAASQPFQVIGRGSCSSPPSGPCTE